MASTPTSRVRLPSRTGQHRQPRLQRAAPTGPPTSRKCRLSPPYSSCTSYGRTHSSAVRPWNPTHLCLHVRAHQHPPNLQSRVLTSKLYTARVPHWRAQGTERKHGPKVRLNHLSRDPARERLSTGADQREHNTQRLHAHSPPPGARPAPWRGSSCLCRSSEISTSTPVPVRAAETEKAWFA